MREGRTINRAPILDGRRAYPDAVDEVVVSEATAEQLDLQAGSCLELVSYGPDQGALLARGEEVDPGGPSVTVTVVAIARTGNDLVQRVQDPSPSLLTPAFYRRYRDEVRSRMRSLVREKCFTSQQDPTAKASLTSASVVGPTTSGGERTRTADFYVANVVPANATTWCFPRNPTPEGVKTSP
jgi:hypothetical protein